ncbi:MAG: 6-phosphogluconolactonase [Micrococcaceae bacterium]
MSHAVVVLHPDEETLKNSIAEKVIEELKEVQAAQGEAHWVLTGGTIGIASLAAIADHKDKDLVDWTKVHFWWGDERFVAADDKDRNAVQAFDALLNKIEIDPNKVYELPATDDFDSVAAAAVAFNKEVAKSFPDGPKFDLVLLGIGPDAHIASLFPGKATLKCEDSEFLSEKDSPKPPPERLTMSMPMLCGASKVWCLVSGSEKADAVKASLSENADMMEYPASAVNGTDETLWLIDHDAAAELDQ